MKTLRFVIVLIGASLFASALAFAADQVQSKDKPKDQPACCCPKDKDGKACGVDKACCCAAKAAKDDKKMDGCKMDDSKMGGCKMDDSKKGGCKKDGCKMDDCKTADCKTAGCK